MTPGRTSLIFIFLGVIACLLFISDLAVGSVEISFSEVMWTLLGRPSSSLHSQIIYDIRLNKAIVAFLAGSSLSVSGMQMQTLFRNPLAGPYVLGISSGASLGVALFILAAPLFGFSQATLPFGIAGAAWIGAALILVIIGFISQRLKDIMVILILGMMFSSGVSAVVQILQYLSQDDALKAFVIWTMGSLGEVTNSQLPVMAIATGVGFVLAVLAIKPLNQLLLGEDYAITMGLNIKRSRGLLFLSTTLLAGTITAFCGPIGFIGLAMPHVTKMIFDTSDHRLLVPGNILTGGILLIVCDIISKSWVIPINAITSLLGIPVIIFVVIRSFSYSRD